MGHLVFLLLHFVVFLFFTWGLILTIPLHLIYAATSSRRGADEPNAATHTRCPACKEIVRKDATVCKHCHTPLRPVVETPAPIETAAKTIGAGLHANPVAALCVAIVLIALVIAASRHYT